MKYMSVEDLTRLQGVALMFYEEYVPKILQNYQHGNVPKETRAFYLFSEPEPLIKTVSISHIAMIGDDRILICINGL